jgi:hypothetical protein
MTSEASLATTRITKLANRGYQLVSFLIFAWPVILIGMALWALEYRLPEIQSQCAPEIAPNLSLLGKSIWIAGIIVFAAAIILSLKQLQYLFNEYRQGRVFEQKSAHLLGRIGKIFMAWWLGAPLLNTLVMLALWWLGEFPEFQPEYPTEFTFLLFGVLLYILGGIMAEAVRVAEEQKLTI